MSSRSDELLMRVGRRQHDALEDTAHHPTPANASWERARRLLQHEFMFITRSRDTLASTHPPPHQLERALLRSLRSWRWCPSPHCPQPRKVCSSSPPSASAASPRAWPLCPPLRRRARRAPAPTPWLRPPPFSPHPCLGGGPAPWYGIPGTCGSPCARAVAHGQQQATRTRASAMACDFSRGVALAPAASARSRSHHVDHLVRIETVLAVLDAILQPLGLLLELLELRKVGLHGVEVLLRHLRHVHARRLLLRTLARPPLHHLAAGHRR